MMSENRGERMKRAAVVIIEVVAVLGMCAWSFGQSTDKPASQTPAAGQAAPAAGQAAAGQAAATQGKRKPAAKTKPEYDAYNDAVKITDPAALEKAADDFAAKFPDSELRVGLYSVAVDRYQTNPPKMMEMARKVLAIDPDDPAALVRLAQGLTDSIRDTDLDKDQKVAEAKKDAEHALVTVETDVPTAGYPPEQLNGFKSVVRSDAYFVLGMLPFKANNWAEAEVNLRKSIEAFPQQPDAFTNLELGVALDMQNKYPEAMKYVNTAVDLTKDRADSGVGKAARDEKDRLVQLSSGAAPGTAAPKK
jgi:tetratricopeptide (TPR) repeat protein